MRKRIGCCLLIGTAIAASWGADQAGETGRLARLASPANRPIPSSRAVHALAGLPLQFVENAGQAAAGVSYILQTRQGNVYFMPQEIVFQFVVSRKDGIAQEDLYLQTGQAKDGSFETNLRVQFMGARRDVKVRALAENQARFSYFRGNDPKKWVREARAYEKLLYSGLYPGIDLLVSGRDGRLKNEYFIRPGGDPADIAICYRGATRLETNAKGQLEIAHPGGTLIEDAPECYQVIGGRKMPVEARYRVEKGRTARIEVGDYSRDADLIIDPVIFATFLGGSGSDYGAAAARDSSGNVYIAGYTASANFPTTGGAYDTTYNGGSFDIFISKFNSSLSSLLYSTYIGGSGNEGMAGVVLSLAVDDFGNAYITGHTDSTDFPTTAGAFDTTYNGNYEPFVTKINSAGSALVFSTYLGGSSIDFGYFIVTDDTGSIVAVGGETRSTDFPTTAGAYDTTHNGESDGFLVVMNSTGTGLVYSSFFGGTGADVIVALAADESGNVYFTGLTSSADLPVTAGAYDTSFNGGAFDGYIAKLDSSLASLSYLTYLGGGATDLASDCKVDEDSGELFVTGRTNSLDFPVTFGAFDTIYNGGAYDAFVSKINSTGTSLLYSTYLGGSDNDGARSIAGVSDRSVVIAGYTSSANFPTTSDGTDRSYNGGVNDIFVTRLSRLGTDLVYSTFLGGISNEDANKIIAADFGSFYIFGLTSSGNFPVTSGAYDTTQNGMADAFVSMMSIPPEIVVNMTAGDFDGDGADEAAVDFGALGAWILDGSAWSVLTASDPEGLMAADIDGNADDEIVADMGTLGLWLWNGGAWTQLSGVNLGSMTAGDADGDTADEIIGDFSTVGLWLWDSGVWTQLSGVNADLAYAGDMAADNDEEIIGDFAAVGLWQWDSGVWTQLSGVNADLAGFVEADGNSKKELAVDFGATGLWLWMLGAWTQLSGINAENFVACDVDGSTDDELAVDFGSTGLWLWNGGAWSQLSNLEAIQVISADTDGSGDGELVADFGYLGLWIYDGGAWSQISPLITEYLIAADVDGNGDDEILADFGDQGLWLWNGGAWTQLSASNPD